MPSTNLKTRQTVWKSSHFFPPWLIPMLYVLYVQDIPQGVTATGESTTVHTNFICDGNPNLWINQPK